MTPNDKTLDLPVLASIRPVIADAEWTAFHPGRLGPAVREWGRMLAARPPFEASLHYVDGSSETVRWVFVLDVLNHCFWPGEGEPAWEIAYGGAGWSGYYGLAASLKRALEDGFPITDAAYLANIPAADLRRIFEGRGQIPFFDERLANLREAGAVLVAEWGGDAARLVEAAGGSAVKLAALVAGRFPSFRDQAKWRGQTVYFWKRAQIFAADLHLAFEGKGFGAFHDVDRLPAFADCKLPQVLRELGIISYHPGLAARIDRRELLPPGCEEEVEIRAMTIHAVDALREAFLRMGIKTNSMDIDNWLWRLGQLEEFRKRPYHRCRTIYY